MSKLRWDGDDFRNEQSSSGTTADQISHSGTLQQGYQHGSLTLGLIAYYPMEKGEGEILQDAALNNLGQIKPGSSGNNTSATDMWNNNSQIGTNCLEFDGTDDYVRLNSPDVLDPIGSSYNVTTSFWFKTSDSSIQQIFGRRQDASRGWKFGIDDSGGVTGYWRDPSSGDSDYVYTDTDFADGSWHQASIYRTGGTANDIVIYVDGTKQSVTVQGNQGSGTWDGSGTSNIGAEFDGDTTNGSNYTGKLTDLRVYNRRLSEPEIQALYNLSKPSGKRRTEKQVPSQDQGGISRYKFNGDVTDSWGSNDGTDNTSAGYTTGVYGQAKNFDGNDDYVSAGDVPLGSSFTFTWWWKLDQHKDYQAPAGSEQVYGPVSGNDGNIAIYLGDGSTWQTNTTDIPFPATEWVHFCNTYDGSKLRTYKNGKLVDSVTGSVSVPSSAQFALGARYDSGATNNAKYYMDGLLDDTRLFSTDLSPQQVEKLYNLGAYRIPRRSTLQ